MINLRGMTWDHSRGFDPMVATSAAYAAAHPGATAARRLPGLPAGKVRLSSSLVKRKRMKLGTCRCSRLH